MLDESGAGILRNLEIFADPKYGLGQQNSH